MAGFRAVTLNFSLFVATKLPRNIEQFRQAFSEPELIERRWGRLGAPPTRDAL